MDIPNRKISSPVIFASRVSKRLGCPFGRFSEEDLVKMVENCNSFQEAVNVLGSELFNSGVIVLAESKDGSAMEYKNPHKRLVAKCQEDRLETTIYEEDLKTWMIRVVYSDNGQDELYCQGEFYLHHLNDAGVTRKTLSRNSFVKVELNGKPSTIEEIWEEARNRPKKNFVQSSTQLARSARAMTSKAFLGDMFSSMATRIKRR